MEQTYPQDVQDLLEKELDRLKHLIEMGCELQVAWVPDVTSKLSGKVEDCTIVVCETDPEKAVQTLRHEFLDYEISKVILPYKEITNRLISMINEQAYQTKEKLIENLLKLLSSC